MSYYQRQRDSELKAIHATWFAVAVVVFFVAGIGGTIVGISLQSQENDNACSRKIEYYEKNWRPIPGYTATFPAQ